MSWRQAARKGKRQKAKGKSFMARGLRRFCLLPSALTMISLLINGHHLSRMEAGQKRLRLLQVELRVAGLDDEEELVLARQAESRRVEDRMVRLGQAVEREHAEDGRRRGEEDRQLEHRGNPRDPRVGGPSADVHRVGDREST